MKNKKFIPAFMMGVFIILFFIYMQYLLSASRSHFDQLFLEDHWTISKDGVVYEDVRIGDYAFDTYQYGERIEYRTILPQNDIPNPILMIYSTHSAFSVKVDGEIIYKNGLDVLDKNVIIGYGFNYIELPQDYYGKELVIQYIIGVNDTFTCINFVQICDGMRVIREQCMDNALILLINFFLIIFGCGVLIAGITFTYRIPRFFKLVCVGMFSIGIAVWGLCNYNLITIFTYNLRAKTYLEFVSLYWAPIPFILYFWDDVQKEDRKKFRPIYYGILICQVLFSIIIFILQALKVCHLAEYLVIEHILLMAMILLVVSMSVYDLLHKNFEHVPLIIGMVLLLTTGLIDVFWFNIQKYIVFFKDVTYFSSLGIGTLLFVIGQIFDFCSEMGKGLYETARTKTLEKLVYADALTDIANRRRCEEEMEKLSAGNQPFGIMAFDLNDLKQVNDKIGHEKGDELIKHFAEILEKTFSGIATVGRMGGDEFIAIFPNLNIVNIDDSIKIMNYYIAEKNEQLQDYKISVAYGYCQSNENGNMDAKYVYKTADARMYKMKYQMKGALR